MLLAAWVASACGEVSPVPEGELAPVAVRSMRQERRNTNKVLILDSSDGDVVLVSTDPTSNRTPGWVENAIKVALDSAQYRTGLYIALGCAYQNAPLGTQVPLLEPFGFFEVAGVPGCATSGHFFQMFPPTLSDGLMDEQLPGDGCVARSVFTRQGGNNGRPQSRWRSTSLPRHRVTRMAMASWTTWTGAPRCRGSLGCRAVRTRMAMGWRMEWTGGDHPGEHRGPHG